MLFLALSLFVSANRALGPPGDPIIAQGEALGERKRRVAKCPKHKKKDLRGMRRIVISVDLNNKITD